MLAPYELDRLVVAASHEYELAANWKLAVENYHECYHCTSIHPELCRVSSPESGTSFAAGGGMWIGGSMELIDGVETMALDGRSRGVPMRGLSGVGAAGRPLRPAGAQPAASVCTPTM